MAARWSTCSSTTSRAAELKAAAEDWPSWDLTPRQVCDLELLMNGAFSPLSTFLGQADYESVCSQMRLADGTIWPMPVCLDLPEELANSVNGQSLALRDLEGVILAVLHVDEVYTPDREAEAQQVFGTTNTEHPGVAHLLNEDEPLLRLGSARGHGHCRTTTTSGRCARRRPRSATEFQQAGLDEGRGLPDPQPDAPGPPGDHPPGGQGERRQPAHPPGGRA